METVMIGYRQPAASARRRAEEIGTQPAAQELLDRAAACTEEAAALLRTCGRDKEAAEVARPIFKAIAAGHETLAAGGRAQRRARQADAEAHENALQEALRQARTAEQKAAADSAQAR